MRSGIGGVGIASATVAGRSTNKTTHLGIDGPVLGIAMPGRSGRDLQRELKRRQKNIPIIFITAQRNEALRPQVLQQGAVECLFKSFSDSALLRALNLALGTS